MPRFPRLEGELKTDVLIIGGGMAGLLCAHFLQQAGVPYILVEGNSIGGGVTKNTTAKLTAQHGMLYQKLLRGAGIEKAKMYLQANLRAVEDFAALCSGMDCDLERKDAYVFSVDDAEYIEDEITALLRLGYNAEFAKSTPLPFSVAGAARFPNQAQFHPLKFMAAISQGLNIYEHSYVRELAPHLAVTDHAKICAKHILVATHFPFNNKHGGYFLKMYQQRSYVIALENAPDIGGMYLEAEPNGLSFRNHENSLLIGGGGHRTGKRGGNWKELRELAADAYPKAKETHAWATQDCMSLDGVPYIGRYGKRAEGLLVATGFNKWGMTNSMVAAQLLIDSILGKRNEYAAVFSPQRSMIKPQLLLNGLHAVGNLLCPRPKRCPHLGCALKWNAIEHSWDCPCHGSRFDVNGALLDNPATGDMKNP